MQSNEYIRQLGKYLKKVPEQERNEALAYYAEYIADAGPEGEQQVMDNLGSPARLAASIRSDLAVLALDENEPSLKKGVSAVWIGVLSVLAAPIALPLAIAAFAVIFSIFISIFAVCFSLIVSAIAVLVSGLACFIFGIVLIPQSGPTALFYIGGGLVVMAIGFFFCLGMVLLTSVIFKGIAKLFANIRKRRAVKKAQKGGYGQYEYANGAGIAGQARNDAGGAEAESEAEGLDSGTTPGMTDPHHPAPGMADSCHPESGMTPPRHPARSEAESQDPSSTDTHNDSDTKEAK
jgi:uncharacterized membrane protein